jgi:hypothetical protein
MRRFIVESTESFKWRTGFTCLYKIIILDEQHLNNDEIILSFFKKDNYLIIDDSALGRPFNLSSIFISDFQKKSSKALKDFFSDFSNPAGWSNASEIKEEINYLKKHVFLNNEVTEYYLINIDQLDKKNEKITIEGAAYLYYILILWVKGNQLNVCQMCLD